MVRCVGTGSEKITSWMENTHAALVHGPSPSQVCFFLWADSSPQAGTDWLLSQLRIIPPGKLPLCVAAAQMLQNSARALVSMAQEQSSELDTVAGNHSCKEDALKDSFHHLVQERHEAGVALQDTMIKHSQIPIGLGSGPQASSLEQKLICICKKFFAETHSKNLAQRVMHRVLGICTDMGTEMGFAQLEEGFAWKQVLPEYMQDSGLQTEEDVLAQCFADQAGTESNFLFGNALPCPGMLHICHNMCLDLQSGLSRLWAMVGWFQSHCSFTP